MTDSIQNFIRNEWASSGPGTLSFFCPDCSDSRTGKNRKSKPLRVTFEATAAVWFCHNCESKGQVSMDIPERSLSAVKESEDASREVLELISQRRGFDLTSLPDAVVARIKSSDSVYFPSAEDRMESIGFYYPGESIKWRSVEGKHFVQSGNAKSPFLLDLIEDVGKIIITEGEFDALSLWAAGYPYAISLAGGSNSKMDSLEPISKMIDDGKIKEVFIAVDSDEPGRKARNNLVNLFGRDKTRIVNWGALGAKDANECWVKHRDFQVAFDKARAPLFDGIVRAKSVVSDIEKIRVGGFRGGAKIGLPGIDDLITVASDQITVVTGVPGSGKSSFLDFCLVQLGVRHGWKFGIFSAENPIDIHVGKLCEIYSGKPIFQGTNRLSGDEAERANEWVDEHFFFLDASLENSLASILARAQVLVDHKQINGLVIDPFNYTDVPLETDAISRMLTDIHSFALLNHIHVWVVAHPQKMYRSQAGSYATPGMMDISGSAAWGAKTDFGLTLSRNEEGGSTLTVWKCRFRWLGSVGQTNIVFDDACGRYYSGVSALDDLDEIWREEGSEKQEEVPF